MPLLAATGQLQILRSNRLWVEETDVPPGFTPNDVSDLPHEAVWQTAVILVVVTDRVLPASAGCGFKHKCKLESDEPVVLVLVLRAPQSTSTSTSATTTSEA